LAEVDAVKVGRTELPDGELNNETVTVMVSEATPLPMKVCVNVVEAAVPTVTVVAAGERAKVSDCVVADEGTTERRPKPIAATATSATRLSVVFVDIIFLSIVALETFSRAASRCIARADASNPPPCIRTRRGKLDGRKVMESLPFLY
jgi:hypothetical protein